MYCIIMIFDSMCDGETHAVPMLMDENLGLFEACRRADLYKKRNKNATFEVLNMENGYDVEYTV